MLERQRCSWLVRSNVNATECRELMAWLRPDVRAHVQCLSSQRALNSYHQRVWHVNLTEHEAWQPGDFRLHVPGFGSRKYHLLRDVSANLSHSPDHSCATRLRWKQNM